MSEDTTPKPCGCAIRRPSPLRPAVPAARTARRARRRQGRLREPAPLSRVEGVSQEIKGNGNRRFQKRYKVAVVTGPVRRRYARRYCRGFRRPRAAGTVQRQPRDQAGQSYTVKRRVSDMSVEERKYWHAKVIFFRKSVKTLSQVMKSHVKDSLAAIELAAQDPAAAEPLLAAMAEARTAAIGRLYELIKKIKDSGLCEIED